MDSCVAYGEMASALADGAGVEAALAAARTLDLGAEVRAAFDVDPAAAVEELRTSGYVIDSLRCAVWAVQQDASFEEVIVALVNRGRDADTTGAIAGGLLGVSTGAGAIPARWREQLEYRDRFTAAAPDLAEQRSREQAAG